jgi:hypothetical protein
LETESKSDAANLLSKVKTLLQSAEFNDLAMYPESVVLAVLHGRLKYIYITH